MTCMRITILLPLPCLPPRERSTKPMKGTTRTRGRLPWEWEWRAQGLSDTTRAQVVGCWVLGLGPIEGTS